MVCADTLSRRSDHAEGIEDNNTDVVMLLDHLFILLIDTNLQDQLSSGLSLDDYAQKLIKDLETDSPSIENWFFLQNEEASALFFKGKQYVSADIELHCQILCMYHDSQTAGHPGILVTFNAVSKYYYWPGLHLFVHNYINGCLECQQFKINHHSAKPSLVPIHTVLFLHPFSQTSMDFLTNLPLANDGSDSLLVLVDHGLMKGVILIPCTKKISTLQTVTLILDHLYKQFGLMNKLISDRDPRFV